MSHYQGTGPLKLKVVKDDGPEFHLFAGLGTPTAVICRGLWPRIGTTV